jgi:hypothetical protein
MLKIQFISIKFIFVAAIFIMLLPLHKESFIINYLGDVNKFSNYSQLLLILLFFISMLSFFLGSKLKYSSKNLHLVWILFATFSISLIIFLFTKESLNGLFSLFYMPLFYLFLFENSKKNYFSQKERDIITLILFIWCVFPIVDSFINNNWLTYSSLAIDSNSSDVSFSGYALHRNVYGLYCTLTALLVLFSQYNKFVKFILYIAILAAIFMSQSRTALLVVLVLTFIHVWIKLPKFRLIFSMLGSLFLFLIFILLNFLKEELGMRNLIQSDDSRVDIIKKLFSKYYNVLLFGSGETSSIDLGLEVNATAHNFIAQTLLDYGVFNLLVFLLIIWQLAIKYSYHSRMLLISIVVYGLTQPYFSFGIPNSYMFFTFSLSIMLNKDAYKIHNKQLLNV